MYLFFWSHQSPAISVLYLIFGLLLLLFPEMSGTVFCRLLAFGVLLGSAISFLHYLKYRETYVTKGSLYLGIFLAIIGLFFLFQPIVILSFLPFILGLILLIDSAGKLPLAVQSMKQSDAPKVSILISTIVPLFLGIILILNPFTAAKGVIMFFGLSLIIDGVCNLNHTYRMHK